MTDTAEIPPISKIFDREYRDKVDVAALLAGQKIALPEIDDATGFMNPSGRDFIESAVRLEGSKKFNGVITGTSIKLTIKFPRGNTADYLGSFKIEPVGDDSFITDIKQDGGKTVLNEQGEVVGIVVAGDRDTFIAPAWELVRGPV